MYKCPNGCDLTGAPIPEKSRQHYGPKTHYSRCIAVYDIMRDVTTHWRCPDCGIEWDRK